MPDLSDPRRDRIQEALQKIGPADIEKPAVLVGWTIICDWMDESGDRWLTKSHSASITHWIAQGMHHEALFGAWPETEEDDDG